ncbi:MAG: hypothetical protein WCJ41_21040 [Aestuariivirga sp.]|uniref:hypothetical protein n=1 Tax=Aestuariivirga sp. TaxID=2650926 RepID=UPI0030178820
MISAVTRVSTVVSNASNAGVLCDMPEDAAVLAPAGGGLAAVVHVKSRAIVTFIRVDRLGPARADVLEGMEPKDFNEPGFSLGVYNTDLLTADQLAKVARSVDVLKRTAEFASELPDHLALAG